MPHLSSTPLIHKSVRKSTQNQISFTAQLLKRFQLMVMIITPQIPFYHFFQLITLKKTLKRNDPLPSHPPLSRVFVLLLVRSIKQC